MIPRSARRYISEAQAETMVNPDGIADDFWRETMTVIARPVALHRDQCFSSLPKLTMPLSNMVHNGTASLPGAPNLVGHFDNQGELGPLFGFRQQIPFFGAGEAALWAETQLLQVQISGCFVHPPF
jgi:hypothetical protein